MEQMIKVQIEGKEYEYPAGTTYQTIAGDFQKEYEDDILLVLFDHRPVSYTHLTLPTN